MFKIKQPTTEVNYNIGKILEDASKLALTKGNCIIKKHEVNQGGLDFEASNEDHKFIGECLNWYGGYIHPIRFQTLIEHLAETADKKFLICCGVHPTKEQMQILSSMNVKVIFFKNQMTEIQSSYVSYLEKEFFDVITTHLVREHNHTHMHIKPTFSHSHIKKASFEQWKRKIFKHISSFRDSVIDIFSINLTTLYASIKKSKSEFFLKSRNICNFLTSEKK